MRNDLRRFKAADLLFRVVMRLEDVGVRESILDDIATHDPRVVSDVRAMIEADAGTAMRGAACDQLESPGLSPQASGSDSIPDIPHYTITRRIASGAMGTVYLAEQHEPVKRTVALKLIRLGMNSTEIVRRFEYERQTLARFDHPGIARVYDAGIAPDGRPFFVMEYVDGARLDDYCDQQRLTLDERLGLFARLCQSVHHAHQRGIIHRDLKPSNILVTERDGDPTPVVIDFGIAKAIHEDAVDQTFLTHRGQLIGTPAYMSPEQAAAGRDMVDVRSDVYALGVILYELMVGSTPLTDMELSSKPFDLICRQIREHDPPRPSARLSEVDSATAATLATQRQGALSSMQRTMREDLDWIIMRAIDRVPDRRYASAMALADDVRRHLRHEPVEAGPPSRLYLIRKFTRRHRGPVAAGVALLTVIVAAAGVAGVFAVQESRARAEMERQTIVTETVNEFLRNMLGSPNPRLQGRDVKVIDLIDEAADEVSRRFADTPMIEADVRQTLGATYLGLGELEKAESQFLESLRINEEHLGSDARKTLISRKELASLRLDQGRLEEAQSLVESVRTTWERVPGHEQDRSYWNTVQTEAVIHLKRGHFEICEALITRAIDHLENNEGSPQDIAMALNTLSGVRYHENDFEGAELLLRRCLKLYLAAFADDHTDVLLVRRNLASLLFQQEKYDEAEPILLEVTRQHRDIFGDAHRTTISSMNILSRVYHRKGEYTKAIEIQSEALENSRISLGETHLDTIAATRNLAQSYQRTDRKAEGDDLMLRVFELRREVLGETHPNTLISMYDAGVIYAERDQLDLAEQTLRRAVEGAETRFANFWIQAAFERELGEVLARRGLYEESETYLLHALDLFQTLQGEEHENYAHAIDSLVELYTLWGREAEAKAWQARLPREASDSLDR